MESLSSMQLAKAGSSNSAPDFSKVQKVKFADALADAGKAKATAVNLQRSSTQRIRMAFTDCSAQLRAKMAGCPRGKAGAACQAAAWAQYVACKLGMVGK
jgi:hypothetical protein